MFLGFQFFRVPRVHWFFFFWRTLGYLLTSGTGVLFWTGCYKTGQIDLCMDRHIFQGKYYSRYLFSRIRREVENQNSQEWNSNTRNNKIDCIEQSFSSKGHEKCYITKKFSFVFGAIIIRFMIFQTLLLFSLGSVIFFISEDKVIFIRLADKTHLQCNS